MTAPATVLLPVYNAEPYLGESLDSLLAQSHTDFEILAIDDASQDGSAKILSDYAQRDRRIRILIQPQNRGLVETLNLGLKSIRSRYVFRQDADDRSHPERIERSLRYFHEHPDTVLLGTGIRRMNKEGRPLDEEVFPVTDSELRWHLLFRNPFAHPTLAFDRERAIEVGSYSASAQHAEDYDLWIRLAEVGKIANLPEILCDYRVHDGAISQRYRKEMENQSAQIGARWFRTFLRTSEGASMAWAKFRRNEPLPAEELRGLVTALLKDRETKMAPSLVKPLLRYFRKNPTLALDFRNLGTLARAAGKVL